jgi:hypothetical protein
MAGCRYPLETGRVFCPECGADQFLVADVIQRRFRRVAGILIFLVLVGLVCGLVWDLIQGA